MPTTVDVNGHGQAFLQADRDIVRSATMKFGMQKPVNETPAALQPSASRAQLTFMEPIATTR